MSLEAWNSNPDRDDMSLLDHMKEDVLNPILSLKSAPIVLQERTVKAAEYVGSRSKIEMERVKMITKTILDAETRARTYGSGSEWRKWVHDNLLYMNGTPIHKEILVNLPSGITVALVGFDKTLFIRESAHAQCAGQSPPFNISWHCSRCYSCDGLYYSRVVRLVCRRPGGQSL